MQVPEQPKVEVDGEDVYQLAPNVKVLRGTCKNKLRMEVEYMQNHGTSDNSYLIEVCVVDTAFTVHLTVQTPVVCVHLCHA